MEILKLSGFTCNTCGIVFQTEEKFNNRHKKKKKINKEKN